MKAMNGLITAIVGAALLSVAGTTQAQYKATGDDGITASPKVRVQLNERTARLESAVPAASVMACASCKDEYVKGTVWTTKGTTKPTVLLAKHLCSGCETSVAVAGTGKGKHNVVTHRCSFDKAAKADCCLTARSMIK
jgi:hypothetical protein